MQGDSVHMCSFHTRCVYHSVFQNAQPVGLDGFRGIGGRPNEQKIRVSEGGKS